MSVSILVQTVCKGYQQTTKVAAIARKELITHYCTWGKIEDHYCTWGKIEDKNGK